MWLRTPSAGPHILPSEDLKEGKTWEQGSGIQLPSLAHCLIPNPSTSVGLSAISPVPMTKNIKISNTVQFLSTGATGLPRIQSMNSMCSLHHAGNTIFTLFIWTIVVDKQGLKTYMMSVNNPRTLALESILKTLKEFLVRPYKRASYRNLPQLKYSKYINNRKPTNQPTEPPPSKSTYLVHAT